MSSSNDGMTMDSTCCAMMSHVSRRRGAWAREMVGSRRAKKMRRRVSVGSCVRVTSTAYLMRVRLGGKAGAEAEAEAGAEAGR